MADEPDNSKRKVRNPDTFRERALKATQASEQSGRAGVFRRVFSATLGVILRPIGRLLAKIFSWKPFRVIGRVIFPAYLRNSWRELKLVTWPNWRQSRQLTFAVLVFAAVFGAAIAIVDYGLDKLFRNILLK